MIDATAVTFIKDNAKGAFCLYESMATWLAMPITECVVLDMGSTDGTLEVLQNLAAKNPRIRVEKGAWSCQDAKAFADAANECVALSHTERVIFWQADEILPYLLLLATEDLLERGAEKLTFWRYQLRENFQKIKWYPHPVRRVGLKSKFEFVGDGMNPADYFDAPFVGPYDGGWFTRWGSEFEAHPETLPTQSMILDVSMVGAFRDNIPDRRAMHSPFWHENTDIEGLPANLWTFRESLNHNWERWTSPFSIPAIMKWHIGRTRYAIRSSLIDALAADQTREYIERGYNTVFVER